MSLISYQSQSFAFDYWPIESIPSPQEENCCSTFHIPHFYCTFCNQKNKVLCIIWSGAFRPSVSQCLAPTNVTVTIYLKLLRLIKEDENQPAITVIYLYPEKRNLMSCWNSISLTTKMSITFAIQWWESDLLALFINWLFCLPQLFYLSIVGHFFLCQNQFISIFCQIILLHFNHLNGYNCYIIKCIITEHFGNKLNCYCTLKQQWGNE